MTKYWAIRIIFVLWGGWLLAACRFWTPTPPARPTATLMATATAISTSIQTVAIASTTTTPTATTVPPTRTPASSASSIPPTATSTAVSPTAPPPTSLPLPTQTAVPGLAIHQFDVEVVDLPDGSKELTFTWTTTGAVRAYIANGTTQRFLPGWAVEPNGALTRELNTTIIRNPSMTLTIYDDADNQVSMSETVTWPCPETYFFTPEPDVCPAGGSQIITAAEQSFEHGRMLWLQTVRSGEYVYPSWIFVIGDDGFFQRFDDTWTAADPESDPDIVHPDGFFQPVRGFGQVWRENEQVQQKLGWATAPEQGYPASWQWQIRESLPAVAYVSIASGRVMRLFGDTSGGWDWATAE